MKKFLLFIVAMVSVFMAMAESKVYIVKTDGTEIELLLSQLDSIRFERDVEVVPPPVQEEEKEEIVDAYNSIIEFSFNFTDKSATVLKLKVEAFEGAISIPSKVRLGEIYDVKVIEDDAFENCTGLTSIEIPNSVTEIGAVAFSGCRSLTEISLPRDVQEIGYEAFRNCKMIDSIILPERLTNLGGYSFADCESLTEVLLPAELTNIEGGAFKNCIGITQIKCKSDNPPYCEGRVFEGVEVSNCRLIVPLESGQSYFTTSPWNEFDIKYDNARCSSPDVKFDNELRQLVFSCDVEGAQYHYTITSSDMTQSEKITDRDVDIVGSYKVIVYATAEGYEPSLPTNTTLVWLTSDHDSNGIIPTETKKAVLIRSNGNSLRISGTERGERIELYTLSGVLLNSVSANGNETIIPCNLPKDEVVIVKYGDKTIKYRL